VDPATGQVFHQAQVSSAPVGGGPPVHHLPYAFAHSDAENAPEARALEGAALAAYLAWLHDRSGIAIRDPDDGRPRAIRWSDIAVLALVTTNLRHLCDALDLRHLPYAMAGGVLFTSDPLHRLFVLGLRAIADRNDGVAEAALLRPPFFAIELLDLVRDKVDAGDASASRAAQARAWLREPRRQRYARPWPGREGAARGDRHRTRSRPRSQWSTAPPPLREICLPAPRPTRRW